MQDVFIASALFPTDCLVSIETSLPRRQARLKRSPGHGPWPIHALADTAAWQQAGLIEEVSV